LNNAFKYVKQYNIVFLTEK